LNVWFDLNNSPHINLFSGLLTELRADCQLTITCQDLSNTVGLLKLHRLDHQIVGQHYGKRVISKVAGYPIRALKLWSHLKDRGVNLAVSQASYQSPLVAKLLGVPSIYMNDNEHSAGNLPAFAFATQIHVPECFTNSNLRRQFASLRKVHRYPGVKEGIYLWRIADRIHQTRAKRTHGRMRIYIRPEPHMANYYRGAKNFLDDLILGLRDEVELTILPRGVEQTAYYADERFEGIRVVANAITLEEIAVACDLFIGAGGTMTREMAVLGIPTLSVYRGELLDVDRWLIAHGAFEHHPILSVAQTLKLLHRLTARAPDRELLDRGKLAYRELRTKILELANDSAHGAVRTIVPGGNPR